MQGDPLQFGDTAAVSQVSGRPVNRDELLTGLHRLCLNINIQRSPVFAVVITVGQTMRRKQGFLAWTTSWHHCSKGVKGQVHWCGADASTCA